MRCWVSYPPFVLWIVLSLALAVMLATTEGAEPKTGEGLSVRAAESGFRGVFFNPNIQHHHMAGYPWPVFDAYDAEYRKQICAALHELATEANINYIDLFIPIPFTLAKPARGPQAGEPIGQWANTTYLDNVALFVDDCHEAGISVEFDLADNRWIPYRVDSEHHIGRPGGSSWPVADDTPWDESATWYREVIERIESRAKHPENIAVWGMMGNYQLGCAEPVLWGDDRNPEILASTEQFVKQVWPVFRAAGTRPKAAPYVFPIFSKNAYWMAKSPEERLSGFAHLKKWLVDDLALPPDYWPMTTYPFCDPAPDGVHYLQRIIEILGPENASRIISTDLKGPGHDRELQDSIISTTGHSGRDMLQWQFEKCAEYGFAGWWIWSYQDQNSGEQTGIRALDGQWKGEVMETIRRPNE